MTCTVRLSIPPTSHVKQDTVNQDILLEKRDGIATITFNRPESRNAINFQGWQELRRIADELATDNDVRVVVFTGSGDQAFSAGADIKDFQEYRHDSTSAAVYAEAFDGATDAIEAIPKPTISLIKGFCIGGGCELSMATDIRIAAQNSRFGIPVAKLSILIGYAEMRRLLQLVGPGHANYILMSGRQLDIAEALRIGLVNQVVPLVDIDEYVYELAQEMVPLAPLSQSRHKEIMRTVLQNPGLDGLTEEEKKLPFANFDSADFREGRQAFLERRTPKFEGR